MKHINFFLLLVCAVTFASAAYYRCAKDSSTVTKPDLTETIAACIAIMGDNHTEIMPKIGTDTNTYCHLTDVTDIKKSYHDRCITDGYQCFEYSAAPNSGTVGADTTVIGCTV